MSHRLHRSKYTDVDSINHFSFIPSVYNVRNIFLSNNSAGAFFFFSFTNFPQIIYTTSTIYLNYLHYTDSLFVFTVTFTSFGRCALRASSVDIRYNFEPNLLFSPRSKIHISKCMVHEIRTTYPRGLNFLLFCNHACHF